MYLKVTGSIPAGGYFSFLWVWTKVRGTSSILHEVVHLGLFLPYPFLWHQDKSGLASSEDEAMYWTRTQQA